MVIFLGKCITGPNQLNKQPAICLHCFRDLRDIFETCWHSAPIARICLLSQDLRQLVQTRFRAPHVHTSSLLLDFRCSNVKNYRERLLMMFLEAKVLGITLIRRTLNVQLKLVDLIRPTISRSRSGLLMNLWLLSTNAANAVTDGGKISVCYLLFHSFLRF